jgi:uncharacterized membrane protein YqjE
MKTQKVFNTLLMLLIIFLFAQFSYLCHDVLFAEINSNEERYISNSATVEVFVSFGCCTVPVWQLVAS